MKGVIFDLDDTLIYSVPAHLFSIRDALKDYNINMKWEEIRRRFGKRLTQILKEVYGITDIETLQKIELKKREYFAKYLKYVIPMCCAEFALRITKEMDLTLTLATMSSRYEVNLVLNKFGWKRYFDYIITNENLPSRPNPTYLLLSLKKMHMKPQDVIAIGDSVYGVEAAHKINMKFIGVTTGAFDKVDLKRAGADFIVKDLDGAVEVLTWLKAQENTRL